MTPLKFVRSIVLKISQAEFARLLGVQEAAVSKWETGRVANPPIISRIRPVVLALVRERRLPWRDEWLFERPVCDDCQGVDSCSVACSRVCDELDQFSHAQALTADHTAVNGNLSASFPDAVQS